MSKANCKALRQCTYFWRRNNRLEMMQSSLLSLYCPTRPPSLDRRNCASPANKKEKGEISVVDYFPASYQINIPKTQLKFWRKARTLLCMPERRWMRVKCGKRRAVRRKASALPFESLIFSKNFGCFTLRKSHNAFELFDSRVCTFRRTRAQLQKRASPLMKTRPHALFKRALKQR